MAETYKVTGSHCFKDKDGPWVMASHHVAEIYRIKEELKKANEQIGTDMKDRATFYNTEQDTKDRILVLKHFLNNQDLPDIPCPLLDSQLNRLEMLCDLLKSEIKTMQALLALKLS